MSTIASARSSEAPKPPAARRRKGPSKQSKAAWILALPFLSLFTVFTAWPVISSLYMSLTDIKSRDLRSPFAVTFVGFDNYARVFGDETFRKSVLNTFYFALVGVPLTLGIALAAAIALDKGITRFRTLFRVGYYTPVVTSIVAVAGGALASSSCLPKTAALKAVQVKADSIGTGS